MPSTSSLFYPTAVVYFFMGAISGLDSVVVLLEYFPILASCIKAYG